MSNEEMPEWVEVGAVYMDDTDVVCIVTAYDASNGKVEVTYWGGNVLEYIYASPLELSRAQLLYSPRENLSPTEAVSEELPDLAALTAWVRDQRGRSCEAEGRYLCKLHNGHNLLDISVVRDADTGTERLHLAMQRRAYTWEGFGPIAPLLYDLYEHIHNKWEADSPDRMARMAKTAIGELGIPTW